MEWGKIEKNSTVKFNFLLEFNLDVFRMICIARNFEFGAYDFV